MPALDMCDSLVGRGDLRRDCAANTGAVSLFRAGLR
jgi:hypothetical protein